MAQPRSCACFAEKAKPCRFVTEVSLTDDLQSHRAAQIDIERLVRDPHRTATQLNRLPVLASRQLVVIKSPSWLVRRWLDRILESRLARFNLGKTL